MKKQFFTFLMMIALVIVAGTAMAQTKKTPYRGGTYTYNLDGIVVNTNGKAQINYVGTAPTGWTFTVSNGTDFNPYTIGGDISIEAGAARTLSFKIAYSSTATDGKIEVRVFNGTETSCSNFIELSITPQAQPTMTYAINTTVTAPLCQNINASPLDDNVAASGLNAGNPDLTTATDNSFTFTVTPVITSVTTAFDYTYKLTLPDALTTGLSGYTITPAATNNGTYNPTTGVVSGSGVTATDATADVYTISFKTTTGQAPVNIDGVISDGSMTVTSGGATYNATVTSGGVDTKTVTVKTMPSIGTFDLD